MQALRSPPLSLPPPIPFLRSIFQNCNLQSPAVQGAPECIHGELHFITHSRTAANFTRSVLQPPYLWPCFFVCEILHCCCMLFSPQLLPCWRRWGELLMACGAQTEVPATASGQVYSTPSSKNTKLKQTAPFKVILAK